MPGFHPHPNPLPQVRGDFAGCFCPVYGLQTRPSILRTVSRCRPKVREASRMLIPSTITARRTRKYTPTLNICRTVRRVGYYPYG